MKPRRLTTLGILAFIVGLTMFLGEVSASSLVPDCVACGCPSGEYCNTETGECQIGCVTGVWAGSCFSGQPPLYCNENAQTVNDCEKCGCPWNQECLMDGSCGIEPVLTPIVSQEYPYNQNIDIYVNVEGVAYGSDVNAKITNVDTGNQITPLSFKWTGSSTVSFSFSAINIPGEYSFQAYYLRSPYPTVWSSEYNFNIKAPLSVTFLVSDPNQYTVKDVECTLTIKSPTGGTVQVTKILTGNINGIPLTLHERYEDLGSGSYRVIIPKEDLRAGVMELVMTVTDPQGVYETVIKRISNIQVNMPDVTVSVVAPNAAKIGDVGTIAVGTNDAFGQPLDIESLSLTINYPDGITFKVVRYDGISNEFRKTSTGKYETTFTYLLGGAYSYHTVATKTGYGSGANPTDPITVVSGGDPGQTCDVSDACDANCPDDPDCQQKAGLPWWLWIVVIGVIIFLGFGLYATRKR